MGWSCSSSGVRGSTVRGNVSSRASSHAFHWRSGGLIEDNLIYRCPIGIDVNVSDLYTAPTYVRRNTILATSDYSGVTGRGWGIEVKPSLDGEYVDNIIADKESASQNTAFMVEYYLMNENFINNGPNPLPPGSIGNVRFDRNHVRNHPYNYANSQVLYDSFRMPSRQAAIDYYTFDNHTIDGHDKDGNPLNLVDPTRDLDDYVQTFGNDGGFEEFNTRSRSRDRNEWNPVWSAKAISDWIRAGFQLQTEPEECECEARFQQIEGQISVLQNQMLMIGQIASGTASVCEEEESNP